MSVPSFVIVGAPKCGTTALSEYLRRHPRIFMCCPKEPHFFALDIPRYRYVTSWEAYRALFCSAQPFHAAVGEASVFYLYSDTAAEQLYRHIPSVRLVVMLRNPVDIAVSMHAQALVTRDEDIVRFDRAWSLCADRLLGRSVPRLCRSEKILLYDRLPLMGEQLDRLLRVFPGDQVRWWFYDDFRVDPGRIYDEVLGFIGVPNDGRTEFPRINRRRRARSQLLAQFTQKTPQRLVRAAMWTKQWLGVNRWGLLDRLRAVNFVDVEDFVMPSDLLAEMRRHFRSDVLLLSRLTGRPLQHWLEDSR